jgi:hypothetical protein
MDLKLFKLFVAILLVGSTLCFADSISDQQLVELVKLSFNKVKSAKTEPECKKAIIDTMGELNDSEKTRAIALMMFEFDRNDGRFQYDAANVVMYIFRYEPLFITNPSPLKELMMRETDPRRFYLLSSIANQLMDTQKSDFVVETTPMLFRHEPLAKMVGEYHFENLSDASHNSYRMIIKNLNLLNADFIPPDEQLPYPDKIAILVKWLKSNYPGCENLGEKAASSQELRGVQATERPAARQEKRIPGPSEDQSSNRTSSGTPWWLISAAATILVIVLGLWFKLKSL